MLVLGRGAIDMGQATRDELAIVMALRAVDPLTVKSAVGVLLKEIGESPSARAGLGKNLGSTVALLDAIHRSGGEFDKGTTHEEQFKAERAYFRLAEKFKPL